MVAERGTNASFEQMKQWLHDCDIFHQDCGIGIDRERLPELPKLPTRVIDVGSLDSEEARLIISQSEYGKYTTLSHRWGGNGLVALTKATLESLKSGFCPRDMPQTFQDAITVTRQLGLRYLWIDTFCIIQDDPEDWATESARMGDIYERAYFNIAATSAINGSEGFLSSGIHSQAIFNLPCAECGDDGCIIFTDQPDSCFYKHVIKAHLNERGWVFQERLLSRRTLHFAKDQVYWECGHHIVSEDGHQHINYDDSPESDPKPRAEGIYQRLTLKHYNLDDTKIVLKKHFDFDCIGPSLAPPSSTSSQSDNAEQWRLQVAWMEILRNYTTCQLTFNKDKLPALQGLASKMSNLIKGRYNYFSGHYVSSPDSLLFTVLAPGGRSKPERCASWSCLSVDAPITFYDCRKATLCLDFVKTLFTPPRKSMDFISLVLSGPLKSAFRGPANGAGLDGKETKPRHFSMHYFSETQYGRFQKTLGPVVFDDPEIVPREFWLVSFYRLTPLDNVRVISQNMEVNCLVLALQKTGRDIKGYPEYCRIGIGHVYLSGFFWDQQPVTFALS